MSLLELEHIDGFHGDLQALFGISLAIDATETVAIIGANGAGKSALMGAIAGLLGVRNGHVRYEGAVIDAVPTHRRVRLGISLVPEGRRLFPSLSTEENLLVGRYAGRAGPWSVGSILEIFPLLRERRRQPAAVLSGGEQQAVAIGRALMANPRLLLLDEVSLGLAPIVVRQLYEALPAITASGCAVLLVEQNVDQALAVGDRVLCLLEGRISLEGRKGELTRDRIASAYFGI